MAFALAACCWPDAALAQSVVIGGEGWRGSSYVPQGGCKYGNTGLNGFLETSVAAPTVSGANVHRRRRSERSLVRYAVWIVDAADGHATLASSNWSSWVRVSERQRLTWGGAPTAFVGDWRGNYRLDLRIEWWRSGRRIGWRAHRVDSYNWFDQYNTGPYGPVSSCHHLQVEL